MSTRTVGQIDAEIWVGLIFMLIGCAVVAMMWHHEQQPERYQECKARCAEKGFPAWTYAPDMNGGPSCHCGGSTAP